MKKILDNFMIVFILFMPFLYLYISYGIKIQVDVEALGFALFTLFFVFIYIYLYKNNVKRGLLIGYLIFMLLAIGSNFISYMYMWSNVKFMLTILYLPIIILFFSNYENKWINQKYISYIYLIYAFILTLSFIFRFNVDLAFEYKKGFIGLFYGSNIISPIIAILMPIALDYTSKCKNYIIKGIFYICTIVTVIFLGTKTVYAALAVYILYALLRFFKKRPAAALITATLLSATIVILPLIPQYQNYRTEKIYNAFKHEESQINMKNIDNIFFNHKLRTARIEINTINNRNDRFKFILSNDYKRVGIDIVDIFLTLGVIGCIFYLAFTFVILSNTKLKGLYKLLFIMIVFASFFLGNIFTDYLVYIFVGVLFLLSKQDDSTKKILLVSNMYPSNSNPSFGIFVKNVYDRLTTKYEVDKVVMTKHNNIITKAFAYVAFYFKTIMMMTFNNYDYVYVHYISHSSFGVLYAMHFIAGTKIVFNAHGNDVVADTKRDEKNIPRSKKYLKEADKVVVPSEYYKDVMVEEYNVDKNEIIVYPSGGVDVELFNKIDQTEAKEHMGFDKKDKYIGYISRIEKDKGYDNFIEAINILSRDKKYNKYKFLVVGDGQEYKLLDKLINEYELTDKVVLMKNIKREDLPYLYNSLDLFVFPTKRKSDSLGLVGLEAMACETLTITSDAKGPLSYAKNKKNAYVFEQGNSEDLANKINEILSLEDSDKDKLRANARKTALEYDSTKMDSVLFKAFR